MARPPASPEQRALQRERIRHAAAEVYNDKGVMGVTVRAISAKAGVSTGTLYSYFANLEELMQSLWIEPVAAVNRRLEAEIVHIDDPVDRIRFLLESYVRFAHDQPDVFRGAVLFVRPAHLPEAEPDPREDLPFFRLLVESIEAGQATGAIEAGDPDLLAQLLWAAVHGALALPVNMNRFRIDDGAVLAAAMIDTVMAAHIRAADAPS